MADHIENNNGHGKNIQSFNANLLQQLQPFVFEIDPKNKAVLHNKFYVPQHIRFIVVSRILCAVPLIFLYFSKSAFLPNSLAVFAKIVASTK